MNWQFLFQVKFDVSHFKQKKLNMTITLKSVQELKF